MHPPPRRYVEPHQQYAPAPVRPNTAAPEARRYPVDRAYSVHPGATGHAPPSLPPPPASDVNVPREPVEYTGSLASAFAARAPPAGYAAAAPAPTEYVPVLRGYSLHPAPPPVDPYRGLTVVPGRGTHMAPTRAVSVYPAGYAPPPRQYLEEREEGRGVGQPPMRY
jgi:hypothetical protein